MLLVIASHAEFLRDDEALPLQARVDLAAIRAASDRAQALTQGLLSLSRRKRATGAIVAIEALVRQRIAARIGTDIQVTMSRDLEPSVRADGTALGHVIDAMLDEGEGSERGAGPRAVRIDELEIAAAAAEVLRIEPGTYVMVAIGAELAGTPDRVEDAVKTADEGEWDLAPGDLTMLMALAAAREAGGTVVRERLGAGQRLSVYLPSVAA
jgi:hypothetical protein